MTSALYSNPLLLTAVLKDMAYPADELFGCSNTLPYQIIQKLSPAVAKELREIVSSAIQQIGEKPNRQIGLKKRIIAAAAILSFTKMLHQNNDFSNAFHYLFYLHSAMNVNVYQHSKDKHLVNVDLLCKHCLEEGCSVDSGMLLTLSYLIYEIFKIGNSLIKTTEYSKGLMKSRKPIINGVQFVDNLKVSDFRKYIKVIPQEFEKLIQKYMATKHKEEIVATNGVVMEVNSYYSLKNTPIQQCLLFAQSCLEKLLKFDIKLELKSSSGLNMIDYKFDVLIGLKTEITPQYTVTFDNSLLNDFKQLHKNIIGFDIIDNQIC